MCLIALALGVHPHFPLVVAANRDEFFERPTAQLGLWLGESGTRLIGGRDLRGGGAAMALTQAGRIAMLTNVRDPSDVRNYTRSRGELVLRWLESDLAFADWLSCTQAVDFAGFNLIVGDTHAQSWHWVSNRSVSPSHAVQPAWPWHARALAYGQIVTISNASLSTPWPKSKLLEAAMRKALKSNCGDSPADEESIRDSLWTALQDTCKPADADLPSTGIDKTIEKALSSCFVDLRLQPKPYGTRSSSLILGKRTGSGLALQIDERSWPLAPSSADKGGGVPALARYSLGW